MAAKLVTQKAAEAFDTVVDFLESFEDLADPRQRGKVLYPLDELLLLVLLGVIAGCESWVEIARYGEKKLALQRRFRPFKDETPSHDQLAAVKSRRSGALESKRRGHTLEQVWIRETNASEPPLTRRNPETCRQNQGRFYLLGQACLAPDYGTGGDRRIGGVKLIGAFVWNCGNQWFRRVGGCEAQDHGRSKWHQPRGESTDAEHWDGPVSRSDEGR